MDTEGGSAYEAGERVSTPAASITVARPVRILTGIPRLRDLVTPGNQKPQGLSMCRLCWSDHTHALATPGCAPHVSGRLGRARAAQGPAHGVPHGRQLRATPRPDSTATRPRPRSPIVTPGP